jgi:hypothetical protein
MVKIASVILLMVFICLAGPYDYFKLSSGDRYTVSTWSCHQDSIGHGDSSFVSIDKVTQDSSRFIVNASVRVQASWFIVCIQGALNIVADINKGAPARVYDCSSKFKTCLWLDTISFNLVWKIDTTFGHIGTESGKITFCFPILDPTNKYLEDDYFRVKTSDSTWFYFNYIARDSCFYGCPCNSHRVGSVQAIRIFPYFTNDPIHLKYADVLSDSNSYPKETIKYLNYDLSRLRTTESAQDNLFCFNVRSYIPASVVIWSLNNPDKVKPNMAGIMGLCRFDLLGRKFSNLNSGSTSVTVIKDNWWDARKNVLIR